MEDGGGGAIGFLFSIAKQAVEFPQVLVCIQLDGSDIGCRVGGRRFDPHIGTFFLLFPLSFFWRNP